MATGTSAPKTGNYFRREWFQIVQPHAPAEVVPRARFWDRAASEQRPTQPDTTVGLLLSKDAHGCYYVENVIKLFATPGAVTQAMVNAARGNKRLSPIAKTRRARGRWKLSTQRLLEGPLERSVRRRRRETKRCEHDPVAPKPKRATLVQPADGTTSSSRVLKNFPNRTARRRRSDALSGAHGVLRVHRRVGRSRRWAASATSPAPGEAARPAWTRNPTFSAGPMHWIDGEESLRNPTVSETAIGTDQCSHHPSLMASGGDGAFCVSCSTVNSVVMSSLSRGGGRGPVGVHVVRSGDDSNIVPTHHMLHHFDAAHPNGDCWSERWGSNHTTGRRIRGVTAARVGDVDTRNYAVA